MRRVRAAVTSGPVLWSLVSLLIAAAIVVQAAAEIYVQQQACFFEYPRTPCADIGDPAATRILVAFLGLPFVWLVGLGVLRASRRLRRQPRA